MRLWTLLLPLVGVLVLISGCEGLQPTLRPMVMPESTGPPPGTGEYSAGVVPVRWMFRYRDGDEHIRGFQHRTYFERFRRYNGRVTWSSEVTWRDKDADDDYNWFVQFAVFAIPNSYMAQRHGRSYFERSGGPHEREWEFQDPDLKGFLDATVVLTGWRFQFRYEDHHVKKVGIILDDVIYDSDEGRLTWKAISTFRDEGGGDDYFWSYDYLVIGISDRAAPPDSVVIRTSECKNYREPTYGPAIFDDASGKCGAWVGGMGPSAPETNYLTLPQGWMLSLPDWFEVDDDVRDEHWGCEAEDDDTHLEKILVDVTSANRLYEVRSSFGPYETDCSARRSEHNVPYMDVKVVQLAWTGGGVDDHPPTEWLNDDQGWHGGRGGDVAEWLYYLEPPRFELWPGGPGWTPP